MFIGGGAWAMVHVWRSEDTLWEMVLSSYDVDPRDPTLVVRHGSLQLYQLILPAQPDWLDSYVNLDSCLDSWCSGVIMIQDLGLVISVLVTFCPGFRLAEILSSPDFCLYNQKNQVSNFVLPPLSVMSPALMLCTSASGKHRGLRLVVEATCSGYRR